MNVLFAEGCALEKQIPRAPNQRIEWTVEEAYGSMRTLVAGDYSAAGHSVTGQEERWGRRNLPMVSLTLLSYIIFLMAQPCTANAQTTQQVARKAFESTVLLVMEDTNGQPISLGSGLFVRDGVVASTLHIAEGASRGYAKVAGQKTKR